MMMNDETCHSFDLAALPLITKIKARPQNDLETKLAYRNTLAPKIYQSSHTVT